VLEGIDGFAVHTGTGRGVEPRAENRHWRLDINVAAHRQERGDTGAFILARLRELTLEADDEEAETARQAPKRLPIGVAVEAHETGDIGRSRPGDEHERRQQEGRKPGSSHQVSSGAGARIIGRTR
jgi:hypothetical protein